MTLDETDGASSLTAGINLAVESPAEVCGSAASGSELEVAGLSVRLEGQASSVVAPHCGQNCVASLTWDPHFSQNFRIALRLPHRAFHKNRSIELRCGRVAADRG